MVFYDAYAKSGIGYFVRTHPAKNGLTDGLVTGIFPHHIFCLTDYVTITKMQPIRNNHDQHVEHKDLFENLLGFCNFVTYVILGSYENRACRSHNLEVVRGSLLPLLLSFNQLFQQMSVATWVIFSLKTKQGNCAAFCLLR